MMDLMILVAVFVAILALAYFTYRNIVGLDTRLRKIEDVLKNAEVVAAPANERIPHAHAHAHESSHVPGWGGEGPEVNVERVEADVPTGHISEDDEGHADDEASTGGVSDDEGTDDEGSDDEGSDDEGSDGEASDLADDDIIGLGDGDEEGTDDTQRKARSGTIRVSDLRDALKKAGVNFPNGAKKALLLSLVEQNNVELSG